MGAGLLRLSVGGKIDRLTRPYEFLGIFYQEFSPTFYHPCRDAIAVIGWAGRVYQDYLWVAKLICERAPTNGWQFNGREGNTLTRPLSKAYFDPDLILIDFVCLNFDRIFPHNCPVS